MRLKPAEHRALSQALCIDDLESASFQNGENIDTKRAESF